MATHKDAIKRHRQSLKRRARNRHYRSSMRNRIKAVRQAVEAGNGEAAAAALGEATSMLHRIAGKGIIHTNTAARTISRLNSAVKALVTG